MQTLQPTSVSNLCLLEEESVANALDTWDWKFNGKSQTQKTYAISSNISEREEEGYFLTESKRWGEINDATNLHCN